MLRKTTLVDEPAPGLIEAIYDATLEPALWPSVLRTTARALRGRSVVFAGIGIPTGSCVFLEIVNVAPELVALYRGTYMGPEHNPWTHAAMRQPPGRALHLEGLVPKNELERSEFFHEILVPSESQQMLAMTLTLEPGLASQLSVGRSNRDRPFDRDTESRFLALTPHFRRAAQLRLRLQHLEHERRAALEALEHLPWGVLLLDSQGRERHANALGREILAAQDGLAVSHGEVAPERSNEAISFRRVVGQAADTARGRGSGSGGALLVSRSSGKRPLQVLVAPLGDGSGRALARGSAVVVFVTDPEREDPPVPEILQRLYGLTPSEAAVALAVAQGHDPRHIAEELRIGIPTVRTHLYRAMAKTDTRRQAELVRVLLCGPAGLRLR